MYIYFLLTLFAGQTILTEFCTSLQPKYNHFYPNKICQIIIMDASSYYILHEVLIRKCHGGGDNIIIIGWLLG